MKHRVVFLDRASLKAKVRKPAFGGEYVEYDKTARTVSKITNGLRAATQSRDSQPSFFS